MLSQQHMEMEQHLHQHCPADVTCPSYYGSGGAMVRCALYCETVQMYCIIHGPLLWGLKSNGKCTLCTLHKYMVSHNYVQFGKKSFFIQLFGSFIMGQEVQRSTVKCVQHPLSTVQHCTASYQVWLSCRTWCSTEKYAVYCAALFSTVLFCTVLYSFCSFVQFLQFCAVMGIWH